MRRHVVVVLKFGINFTGELLAQFHTPLVEAENIPDHPLHEDFVLVQRNQITQRVRRNFFQQNRVGRAVALEHFEGHDVFHLVQLLARFHKFGFHFFFRFAVHERLGLGEKVGK